MHTFKIGHVQIFKVGRVVLGCLRAETYTVPFPWPLLKQRLDGQYIPADHTIFLLTSFMHIFMAWHMHGAGGGMWYVERHAGFCFAYNAFKSACLDS